MKEALSLLTPTCSDESDTTIGIARPDGQVATTLHLLFQFNPKRSAASINIGNKKFDTIFFFVES